MLKASATPQTGLTNEVRCCNPDCGKLLAKGNEIKCRCGTCTTRTEIRLHFYPGTVLGGGSMEAAWQKHFSDACKNGCEQCGIKPGETITNRFIIQGERAWRIENSNSQTNTSSQTQGSPILSATTTATTTPAAPKAITGSHDLAALYTPVPASLDTIGTDYKLPEFAAADPQWLAGKRVLVISADGPELPEIHVPMAYLKERGAEVKLAGQDWIFQWRTPAAHIVLAEWLSDRVCVKADLRLSDVRVEDYDAVFIPGGAWNPDMLRTDEQALRIVREAHTKELLVVSLCHGPQVIINAAFDAPEGQKNFPNIGVHITGTGSIRRDLKNAGFVVHNDKATVYDESACLLTARDPNDLGPLCEKFGELLKKR
ncbi:MAG: DJ-1/PfpI family protein [Candidatus Obscuribacterales bacterium]|nr:DJ-1/PfpI family protein [Candidatus Obscuribacterales bacterium]